MRLFKEKEQRGMLGAEFHKLRVEAKEHLDEIDYQGFIHFAYGLLCASGGKTSFRMMRRQLTYLRSSDIHTGWNSSERSKR